MTMHQGSARGLMTEFVRSQGVADEFEACRQVVERYFGSGARSGSDTDLYDAARERGIRIARSTEIPYEGVIERDQDGVATITLRQGLNRRRERFTLAHELGHWLLQEEMLGTTAGKLFRGVSRDTSELRDEERLANLLAAEILVPFEQLREIFQSHSKLQALLTVCRRFGVSRTMAVRRIADVCEQAIILLQIVPYLFKRPESAAEVDDAVFATPRQATLFDRNRTKLVDRFPYEDLLQRRELAIQVQSPKGQFAAAFELDHRPRPIPHTFALACLDRWPVAQGLGR